MLLGGTLTVYREIIDESDVYVDVHKAIRRAHPAPKAARTQRRDVLLKDAAVKDGTLVDLSEEDADFARRTSSGGRNDMLVSSGSPKPTSFFMRRGSAGQKVSVKANFEDMREHLKHLGPSNPASNPKSTRVSAVKIKPGLSQSPEQRRSDSAATETLVADPEDDADEHTTLLRPEQRRQHGHMEYGSWAASGNNATGGAEITVKIDSEPAKDGSNENSPTDSTGSNLGVPRRSRGHARSGSITENVIEAGGVRKVVLRLVSTGPTTQAQSSSADASSTTLNRDQAQQDDSDENGDKNGENTG